MTDKPLWMPLHVADYLKDTRHLSTIEHGAYLLLLMSAWIDGGRLPNDPDRLRRLAGLTAKEWRASRSVLLDFFSLDGDFFSHKRVSSELAKAGRLIEQKRAAGKASAAAKAAQRNDDKRSNSRSTGVATGGATNGQRQANQSQSHSLSNDKGALAPDEGRELFSEGVALLVSTGSNMGPARSLIGKWRKSHGDAATLRAIREAARQQITDPRAWITKTLHSAPANDASALIQSIQRTYGGK